MPPRSLCAVQRQAEPMSVLLEAARAHHDKGRLELRSDAYVAPVWRASVVTHSLHTPTLAQFQLEFNLNPPNLEP